jgi:hypothetical protein
MTPEQRKHVWREAEAKIDRNPGQYTGGFADAEWLHSVGYGPLDDFEPDALHPSSFYVHPRRYWTPWRLGAVAIISSLSVAGFALLVGACMAKY